MTVTISLEQAVRVARQVAKERPDHIDTMKGFSHNYGCLAGVVLYRLGMEELYYRPSPEEKVTLGDAPVRYMGIAINSPAVARNSGMISCDEQTMYFLEALMQHNDANYPWGTAVSKSEVYVENHFGIEMPSEKSQEVFDPWAVEAIRASDPKPDPEEEEKEEDKESAAMWEQLYDQINNPKNKESDAHLVSAGS